MTEGIDWEELNRRFHEGDGVEYLVLETMKAGSKAARCLSHPLDRYLNASTITHRQYDAGLRLYEDYTISQVRHSGSNYDGTPPPESFGPSAITDMQLDASRRYTDALRQVGRRASVVLVEIVLAENSAESSGRRLKQTRFQIVGALKLALDMLADHYKLPQD